MGSFLSLLIGEAEEEGALSLLELLAVADQQPQDNVDVENQNLANNHLDWNRILRRLRTHPEEAAAYCHSVDASPLLRCLSSLEADIPTAVIRAFLDAYDDTIFHSDRNGVTPLLAAVRRTAVVLSPAAGDDEGEEEETTEEQARQHAREIIQLLMEANPEAVRVTDKTGKLPLHFARTDTMTAERLVEAFPEAVHQVDTEQGRLPLHYYCCLAPEKEEDEQQNNDDNNNNNEEAAAPQPLQLALPNPEVARLLVTTTTSNPTHPVLCKDKGGLRPIDILCRELTTVLLKEEKEEATLDTLWEVLTILVQSVVIAASPFQMVHALVSLRCPAVVMAEALRRSPEQAVERDAQGRTPLLIAVGMLDHKRSSQQKDADMCQVICELLKCNSTAARMLDREGRLAIDALAESGVFDEQLFECLVKAEPRAVDTRDLKNKQHPFVTAALAGPDKSNVSSVYHLLRAKPHVIQYYCLD